MNNKKIVFLAVFACFIWSTAFVGIKVGLRYFPPLTMAGVRFIIAGLMVLPFAGRLPVLLHQIREGWRTVLLVALFQTVLLYGFFFMGMTMVRGAQAAIVIGVSPLISGVMAHIFMENENLSWRRLLSLLLGILGIVVLSLSSKPWKETGSRELTGLFILLGGSITSAAGNIAVAKEKKGMNPISLSAVQMFLGGTVLLVIGILAEKNPGVPVAWQFYLSLCWLSAISAAGFSIWFYLLKRAPVTELNLWKFIIPVFGALLSWLLLPAESPDILSVSGMVLIGGSICLFYRIG